MNQQVSSATTHKNQYRLHIRSIIYQTAIVSAESEDQAKEMFSAGEIDCIHTQCIEDGEVFETDLF